LAARAARCIRFDLKLLVYNRNRRCAGMPYAKTLHFQLYIFKRGCRPSAENSRLANRRSLPLTRKLIEDIARAPSPGESERNRRTAILR
jgi:hypothetical protein